MSHPINLRQIEAFRAVILTGSMTGAGKILNISQPAVSRLIRDLERDLGLRLFKRGGSHITPNEEALLLNREVERMFVGSETIRETAASLRGVRTGTLRVAVMPNLALGYLSPPIRRFLESHPGTSVTLHEDSSVNIIDLVSRHQHDVGLAYVPTPHPGVEVLPLPSTDAVCVLPPDHALAAKQEIHVRNLDGQDFIRLGSSSLLRHQIHKVMEAANVHCINHIEVRYAATACTFVSRGMGISVVDPFAVHDMEPGRICIRPFRPRISYEFSVVLPAWRPRAQLVDDFVTVVRETMERDFGAPEEKDKGGNASVTKSTAGPGSRQARASR